MSIYDITYCVIPCGNMQCERNIKHLEGLDIRLPISQASFDKCEKYKLDIDAQVKILKELSDLSSEAFYGG